MVEQNGGEERQPSHWETMDYARLYAAVHLGQVLSQFVQTRRARNEALGKEPLNNKVKRVIELVQFKKQ